MSAKGFGLPVTLCLLTLFAALAGLSGTKAYAAQASAQIHLEAEVADRLSGAAATEGGGTVDTSFSYVTESRNGGYLRFDGVAFGLGFDRIAARVATAEQGGSIEFRIDSPTGELLGKLDLDKVMENTGEFADGRQNRPWTTATLPTQSSVSSVHSLYVVFKQENDLRYVADLDWIELGNDPLASKHTAGVTYHVDAYDGKDSNHGKTALAAFRTISRAAEAARPGDTIIIHEGTYHEAVYVTSSGTSADPITFRAAEGEHPVIDGSDLPAQPLFTVANTANYITISGLTLQNGTGAGFDILGDHVSIEKCLVDQVIGSGIHAIGASNLYATNNEITGTIGDEEAPAGVSITESKNVTLRGNKVHDNEGAGISLNGLTVGAIVIENTLYRNHHAELELNGVSDAFVERNFIYEPTKSEAGEQADDSLPAALAIGDDPSLPECITQNNLFRNNLIANTGAGIIYRKMKECSGFEQTIIENNTFAGIRDRVLSVKKGDYALVDTTGSSLQNNIFYGVAGSVLVDIDTPGNVMLTNNLFYRDSGIAAGSFRWGEGDRTFDLSDWQDLSGLDKVYDNVWGDPQFVLQGKKEAETYELQSSSPAIDAGAAANAPSRDFTNADRPVDGNGDGTAVFDIGAYEFSGA